MFSTNNFRALLLFSLAVLSTTSCVAQTRTPQTPQSQSYRFQKDPTILRVIRVIQKSDGVFIYKYKGSNAITPFSPYLDFTSKKKITSTDLISKIKQVIEENKNFKPEYKKRCLPKWEAGVEFRKSKTQRKMLLFSFSCTTMMIYENKVYRDFAPQKEKIYKLLYK